MSDSPKIYLVKIVNDDNSLYKIGFTKGSVHKRIKELQTGCPYEIHMVNTYNTEFGMIIERTLHNIFSDKKTYGEWFKLDLEDEMKFEELCNKYEEIQKILHKK